MTFVCACAFCLIPDQAHAAACMACVCPRLKVECLAEHLDRLFLIFFLDRQRDGDLAGGDHIITDPVGIQRIEHLGRDAAVCGDAHADDRELDEAQHAVSC